MDTNQIQEQISIIKNMIDKTRRETAESGYLLIFIGIFSALTTVCIALLEMYEIRQWEIPSLIIMTIINGIAAYFVAVKADKKERVKSYTKTIFWNLWMICGFSAIMVVFVFPFLGVYTMKSVPVLVSTIMGIALFITGVIFELKFIQWISLVWWIGAVLMATIFHPLNFLIMIAVILIGWILPGMLLNKNYKNRRI